LKFARGSTYTSELSTYPITPRDGAGGFPGRYRLSVGIGRYFEQLSYLQVLAVGVVLERYISYFLGSEGVIFGQPAGVLLTFGYFGLAALLWARSGSTASASGTLRLFLLALSLAWVLHVAVYRIHGDAFNYTALLYLPILGMIAWRPLSLSQAIQAARAFMLTVVVVILATFILERFGAIAPRSQSVGVVNFDEERYFLPFNELLGIEGRWPGPFGHNGDTAMMAALLIVFAVGFWSRLSWLFVTVGIMVFALTDGRASIGAAAAGLLAIWMLSRNRKLSWAPQWMRLATGSGVLLVGALLMLMRPAGLTGRERIWPAFLEIWWESPWIGVGGSGFATGNEITQQFGHAHSLYIEELARSGLIGFMAQFVALGIGVFIAARAAGIGYPGPLAVMVAYFVTGVTEPRNNWIEPSATWFLLILMVLAASARLVSEDRNRSTDREEDSLSSSPPA